MFQQRPSFQCTVHIYFITFYLNYILIHLFAYRPTFHFSVSIIYFSFYSDVFCVWGWCVWHRSMVIPRIVELCLVHAHSFALKSVYVFYSMPYSKIFISDFKCFVKCKDGSCVFALLFFSFLLSLPQNFVCVCLSSFDDDCQHNERAS